MQTRRLDKGLLAEGLVTPEQMEEARQRARGSKRPLQDELVEMGFISEEQMVKFFLSMDDSIESVDLFSIPADTRAIELVPYDLTQRYGMIPVKVEDSTLVCAMSNPFDIIAKDDIKQLTGLDVKPVVASRTDIMEAVKSLYSLDGSIYDIYKNMSDEYRIAVVKEKDERDLSKKDLEKDAKMLPIIKLVNMMIADAVKVRASDIHLEPKTGEVELRYRIDGVLRKIMNLPTSLLSALVSRIKIISDLDIAERRKPQDGRAKIEINNREVDLRISVLPTFLGEKAVIRILDSAESGAALNESIGFSKKELAIYRRFIKQPQGMILLTGPTGSGKTTTLYASLKHLNDGTKNITTVENPVEYQLDGINQIQINEAAGVTFASSLRSILQQDPNVVLVGEIRDYETAEIAFQASQTGHLVLSTVHTNNTVSTITRLVDIGVEHFLIASSVIGVIAQRLVRKLCLHCRQPYQPHEKELAELGIAPGQYDFHKETGCDKCGFTGYSGRTAIFEILDVNEKVKALIASSRPENEIFDAARTGGMRLLVEAGLEKAKTGITSIEEVQRVASFGELTELFCPECNNKISKEFSSCPYCGYKLMRACSKCKQPIESDWKACPYCGSEATDADSQEISPVSRQADSSSRRLKLLTVDDDPNVRKIIQTTFRREPYEVIEAVDGKEGLEKAYKENPDLVIIDVMMPRMSGYDLCRQLRSNFNTGSIPIMMLTAKTDLDSEAVGLDAGADDYLTKPFEPQRLVMRVKSLLNRHQKKTL